MGPARTSRSKERRSVRARSASIPSTSISLTFRRRSLSFVSVLSCQKKHKIPSVAHPQGPHLIRAPLPSSLRLTLLLCWQCQEPAPGACELELMYWGRYYQGMHREEPRHGTTGCGCRSLTLFPSGIQELRRMGAYVVEAGIVAAATHSQGGEVRELPQRRPALITHNADAVYTQRLQPRRPRQAPQAAGAQLMPLHAHKAFLSRGANCSMVENPEILLTHQAACPVR